MAKLRVVLAEIEGSDESVLETARSVVSTVLTNGAAADAGPAVPAVELPPKAIAVAGRIPQRRAVHKPQPADEEVKQAPGIGGRVIERVLSALKKRPMTSGEVITAVGLPSQSVYIALSSLRKNRQVETREDPKDGSRKNFYIDHGAVPE